MAVLGSIKGFASECRRVLKVTKKPGGDEFKQIVKISGLGIILIGVVGFLVHIAKQLIVR